MVTQRFHGYNKQDQDLRHQENIREKKVKHDLRQSYPLRSMVFQFAGFYNCGRAGCVSSAVSVGEKHLQLPRGPVLGI